jgi:serine/threonine protein kinase
LQNESAKGRNFESFNFLASEKMRKSIPQIKMYVKIDTETTYGSFDHSNSIKGIVMELLQGSLVDKFHSLNWQITEKLIIKTTCDIIDALQHIHQHGIIH